MKKTILIGLGIIVAVAGFLFLTRPSEEAAGTPSNHQYSQGSSGVIFMEYGDFQCPGCKAYYPVIKQVKEIYKDKVTFQFRNLPLESIHPNARAAARAAEAAHLQGKFWEMHDALFESQDAWKDTKDPVTIFTGYAQQLQLDVTRFATDYKSSTVNAVINADIKEFEKTGEEMSTPTFFIDGKRIDDLTNSPDYFQKLLDEAIAAKTPPPQDPLPESSN
ncbi:MAG: DsbA family protein [bacterium]|nr:DsbA family protein [bacterium]